MKGDARGRLVKIAFPALLIALTICGSGAAQAEEKPLTVGYAALVAEMSPLWNAYEAKLWTGIAVNREALSGKREELKRFMKAYIAGIAQFFQDLTLTRKC